MPAHSVSGDDGGGIDGPRHASSLRIGCGAVNPVTARDCPGWAAVSWPIYNGFDHQPTENELKALHEQDVAPAQAKVIDKLYDQLMSADKKMRGNLERRRQFAEREPIEMARGHAIHALERFALPALLYCALLAVGIRATPMVV
jgi:hypothetical protein